MTEKEKIKQLHQAVKPFAKTVLTKSVRQLLNTLIPLFILWIVGYMLAEKAPIVAIVCGVVSAGFVIRTFIIFHDCTHGSFFKSKKTNQIVGTITGILTMFAYSKWRREHLIHHAGSSNLDKRGIGDIWVMTVDEYKESSKWQRWCYRMYRNPFVMFGLGPLYLVLVTNRINRKDAKWPERFNTYFTNVMCFAIIAGLVLLCGWQSVLLVHGTTVFVSAALGIWLFFIQHTFEDSYFENSDEWNYVKAAVDGSSYYELPKFLQWLTGNIGYHHVHHLAPRVPNYALEEAHEKTPPLHRVTTITIKTSLQSLKYKVYDHKHQRFITFKEMHMRLN